MIIINDKPGQLCNQLWSYIPLIARALKYKVTFLSLYFEDNYHHFENLNCNKQIKFGFFGNDFLDIYFRKIMLNSAKRLSPKLLNKFGIYVDPKNWRNEKWEEELLRNNSAKILSGTGYRRDDIALLEEFHEEIRRIFRPKDRDSNKVNEIMNLQKFKYDIIIGVHMRRGDYKEFLNGVYYFNDETYANYMLSLKNQFKEQHKTVGFLVCSNEQLNLHHFNSLPIFQIENSSSIQDLFALSICDLIIGPPSTFSMWASYYGRVPLRFLKYKNENIKVAEFSRIVAQDIFLNGTILTHASVETN